MRTVSLLALLLLSATVAAGADGPGCAGDLRLTGASLMARRAGRGATLRVRARVQDDDRALGRSSDARVTVQLGDVSVHLTTAAGDVTVVPVLGGRGAVVRARGRAAVAAAPSAAARDAALEVRAEGRCGLLRFDEEDCVARTRLLRCAARTLAAR